MTRWRNGSAKIPVAALCVSLASLPSSLGYLAAPSVFPPARASLLSCLPRRNLPRAGNGRRLMATTPLPASSRLHVEQFECLKDNYGYLVHDPASGETAAIDTPEVEAIVSALDRRGWKLTHIWNTHHHLDHTGANLALKQLTGCQIVGPLLEQDKIAGMDVGVSGGDAIFLGGMRAEVMDVRGHTRGHIAFHFPEEGSAFVGDALFAMGCGRCFEGTHAEMFASILRLAALPPHTLIYCAHEYTASNARFALSLEPSNPALQARVKQVQGQRERGEWTVPSSVGEELETNPFLRYRSPSIRKAVGAPADAPDVEVFAAIRRAKDVF